MLKDNNLPLARSRPRVEDEQYYPAFDYLRFGLAFVVLVTHSDLVFARLQSDRTVFQQTEG